MRLPTLLASLPSLVAVGLMGGCAFHVGWDGPDAWVEETEQFDLAAGEIDRLVVTTHNGPITVRAGAAGDELVRVTVVKKAGGDDDGDAREALSCLNVARSKGGGTLDLRSEWARSPRSDWGSMVSFEVTAPARLAARLESHNGAIRVDGLRGDLDVLSHNGRLALDAPARRVAAITHNGAIEYRGPAEVVAIQTHNGRISAALTGGVVNGTIGTKNGAIRVDAADTVRGTIEGETDNGSIAVRGTSHGCTIRDDWFKVEFVDPATGRLEVRTNNGSIEVR